MTWHSILYNLLLLATVVYALTRGGAPERIFVVFWVVSNALSSLALAQSSRMFWQAELGLFAVDVASFLLMLLLSLAANRQWLLFATAMQGGSLMVHFCKMLRPSMMPFGYALGSAVWSYPILLATMAGVRQHRLQMRRSGRDPSWSRSFGLWTRLPRKRGPLSS